MFARVSTVAFQGIEPKLVDVQVGIGPGLPAFTIVGLPDKAVAESRERVRAAFSAIGLALPPKRITVNLAPADLPKEGSHYDLPIALGIMIASGALPGDQIDNYCAIGELALDGGLSHVVGALPAAIGANAHDKGLICPAASGAEAAWAGARFDLVAAPDLLALVNHFRGHQILPRPERLIETSASAFKDFRDVKGQESAKRALEIAAAGGHHVVMIGPPGAGKSMLAERLPSILPPMTAAEMLEVSMIRSMAGTLAGTGISGERPFRAPHHSASMAALVGGGSRPRPGEVALAHLGVLFLDELPEFSPRVLDALRQPLEAGVISIARANHRICYPSRIQLVAAMNPCRCGFAGEPGHSCRAGQRCSSDYLGRVSGPLWDRMDIQIDVPRVRAADLALAAPSEGSAQIRARVTEARKIQHQRYRGLGRDDVRVNADCPAAMLDDIARPEAEARALLLQASENLGLSARGYHRTLRLARTLADLDGADAISRVHIAEALSYRREMSRQAQAA